MTDIKLINLPYVNELVQLYPYFRDLPYPILLDSNQTHFNDSDYDILVADPLCQISALKNTPQSKIHWGSVLPNTPLAKPLYNVEASLPVFDYLQSLMDLACQEEWAQKASTNVPFTGGLLGYFGYDSGQLLEKLPNTVEQDIDLPLLQVGLYGWALISAHKTQQTYLMMTPWCDADVAKKLEDRCHKAILTNSTTTAVKDAFSLQTTFHSNISETEYEQKFNAVQDYIHAGDCYQVNLAQRFSSRYIGDTFTAYQRLRQECPTPFSAYLELDHIGTILSHSPERFLQIQKGLVSSKPIKGTRARGKTEQEDQALADELMHSPKDKAENLMIVDLIRNDLGKTCITGSIKVPALFALESYTNVHHLVSTVTGNIQAKEKHMQVFRHSFPGGSITGAPKIRAMEIIDELEPHQRSVYCGSIAYFSVNGEMDSSITIRSLVADKENIHCWAGGGLVVDSKCQEEYKETFTKVQNLTHTLESRFLK